MLSIEFKYKKINKTYSLFFTVMILIYLLFSSSLFSEDLKEYGSNFGEISELDLVQNSIELQALSEIPSSFTSSNFVSLDEGFVQSNTQQFSRDFLLMYQMCKKIKIYLKVQLNLNHLNKMHLLRFNFNPRLRIILRLHLILLRIFRLLDRFLQSDLKEVYTLFILIGWVTCRAIEF